MLQETLLRLDGLETRQPIIICNQEHRFLLAEQLREAGQQAEIILEPVGRNTAPAIALAALRALQLSPEQPPVLLVQAADHVIRDIAAFHQAIEQLLPQVQQGAFGILGIVPTEAATGYGYIRTVGQVGCGLSKVVGFVEKPDADTAAQYLADGGYLWNSGMFMLRADRYLAELQIHQPEMYQACQVAMQAACVERDFTHVDAELFSQCPEDSIDYALMEPLCARADSKVLMASLNAGWSDVGSWSALWDVSAKDGHGNVLMLGKTVSQSDVFLHESSNCMISAHSKVVTVLGLDNLVVVDTDDALLVADKSRVEEVRKVVNKLKAAGRKEHHSHREVYRPWGRYDSVDVGYRYQVKRITVKPGAKLSLQMHHHRAEHWVVVSGTAKVTVGEQTFLVTENQSTYIPIGQVHCLENPGSIPLEIIEVQSGAYLGEDDIVRLKDDYGRC